MTDFRSMQHSQTGEKAMKKFVAVNKKNVDIVYDPINSRALQKCLKLLWPAMVVDLLDVPNLHHLL